MSSAGPVGFQSNNVPLTAGMFTSIGTCPAPKGALGSAQEVSTLSPTQGWTGGAAGAQLSPGPLPAPRAWVLPGWRVWNPH